MRIKIAVTLLLLVVTTAAAEDQTISFPAGVTFETGDTWLHEGKKFRLFGVQSCLRNTTFHAPEGGRGDCGMRSIASLAALFSTGTVGCQPVGTAKDQAIFVVCGAEIGGATVDVGTALVSSGAAFAAVFPSGAPVSSAYAVAELAAQESASGLWSGSFDHPVTRLQNGQ